MLPRRQALQTLALGVSAGIAGCQARQTTTENSSNVTTTDPQPDAFELTAEILSSASSNAPAKIEATLRNTGTTDIEFTYGSGLVFRNQSEDGGLVLDPGNSAGSSGDTTYTDGCWRYPEDGQIGGNLILRRQTLSPDAIFTKAYDVYTRSNVKECFPAGMHLFEESITVTEVDTTVEFTLGLEISSKGALTVDSETTEAQIDSSN